MLMRALGESVPPAEEVPFSDVVQGEWYYEPIAKALNLELQMDTRMELSE